MAKKGELTLKQQRFCEEYMVDMNATQAAIRANYSVKTAGAIGRENLQKPLIGEYIAFKAQELAKATNTEADFVMKGLKGHALNAEKDSDSIRAYELIGKKNKMFTDKIEHGLDSVTFNFMFDGKEKE